MKITTLSEHGLCKTYAVIDTYSAPAPDKPEPYTLAKLQELSKDETVRHAGMLAARFESHPEHGDVIIITSGESGGIMIHS